MTRSKPIIHQPDNMQFIQYVIQPPTMMQPMPPNYIPPNQPYISVIQPLYVSQCIPPINNSPTINKHPTPHQQPIISPTPLQPQSSTQVPVPKRQFKSQVPQTVNKLDLRPFSPEEDQHILNMANANGLKFDVIANSLHDRSAVETKNRFYTLQRPHPIPSIQPKQTGFFGDNEQSINDEYSSFFFKHVPYSSTSDHPPHSNFQFPFSKENHFDTDMRTLYLSPPGIENSELNIP